MAAVSDERLAAVIEHSMSTAMTVMQKRMVGLMSQMQSQNDATLTRLMQAAGTANPQPYRQHRILDRKNFQDIGTFD